MSAFWEGFLFGVLVSIPMTAVFTALFLIGHDKKRAK